MQDMYNDVERILSSLWDTMDFIFDTIGGFIGGIPPFVLYLIAVNLVSFAAFALDYLITVKAGHEDTGFLDGRVMCLFAVAGGPIGMLAALFTFTGSGGGRRVNKYNIAWWFSAIICLIVWAVIVLTWAGVLRPDLALESMLGGFNKTDLAILGIYLAVVNLAAFGLFYEDKEIAKRTGRRVPELYLLGIALAGGSAGGLLAMRLFRHKTLKWYFAYGLPTFIVLHAALFIYAHDFGLI